ncbi:DUF4376 domain-containing protein [Leisingera sp. NJS204]|uniref:DUF4376 domain-containing protein n=1 Tax=Leisingera sp. NJS204 TaxID=2508307 RepID=UPI001011AA75|nr:DUF4376 domain-containing protein [Leisingera sp. NJS204]QAX29261.1 DUF4376 domain-containing protein [Leisingera sp. NJS204]QAX29305.1 DUF4376 domain-containing protein [Leisingera sp. NJS204]
MTFSLKITTSEQVAAAARTALLADLADTRWKIQNGGITLPSGFHARTDRTTRADLTEALSALQLGIKSEPFSWKAPDGWIKLTRADLEQITAAVAAHVQGCFDAEEAVEAQITALNDAELAGFDVSAAFTAAPAAPAAET